MAGSGLALLAVLTGAGCGYRPVHAAGIPTEAYAVTVVTARVTPTSAADAVAAGLRDALAADGALRGGEGYPRVEIEVVRVDEDPDAIGAITAEPGGRHFPRARGLRLGVVARAWVRRRADAAPELDTGDVRAFASVAADAAATSDGDRARVVTAESAGREAGRRLGARLLGHPALSE